ncbi:MAG: sodium:calcium antiporter [Candidatus Dojkabacteria bacterium]
MLNILIALVSFIVLLKSADIFVDQSTAFARKIKVSSFLIGFTLIALGTSLPDLVISTYSALKGHQEVAISTFLGSALVNISLLLGALAIFTKYKLVDIDVKKNIPITLAAMIIFLLLLLIFQFQMTWIMGILTILLLLFFIFLARKNNHTIVVKSDVKFNVALLILSFLFLILTGKLCVDNILSFASNYGIAETTIGYFVLAIGISIPELVTSFTVIKKGNLQLSLGNILGATLINILLISGLSSFVSTLDMKPFIVDIFFLIFAVLIFYIFALMGRKRLISHREGIGLILVYIIFILLQTF